MGKTSALSLVLVFTVAFCTAGFLPAKADPIPLQYGPTIYINRDGTVTPETDLISRNGNTYTLTADVNEYQIYINCSNVILDGNKRAIRIMDSANVGIWIYRSENVTVKNIEVVADHNDAIGLMVCSNCKITGVKTSKPIWLSQSDYNIITESTAKIHVWRGSDNNVFTRNNITELSVCGPSNVFYLNNMLLDDVPFIPSSSIYFPTDGNSWDNGSIGNYWGNYTARYPNASEVGYSGVGNTPYSLFAYTGDRDNPYVLDGVNVDYYPLMYTYDIKNDTIAFPTREPFPTALVIAVSAAGVVLVGAGLIVYFRRRKR